MSKPIIRLYDHAGTGLIIEYPSGVIYTNQAGGVCCMQPKLEGVFIPIGNDVALEGNELKSPAIALWDYFVGPKYEGMGACNGLDKDDAEFIETALENALNFDWIKVDRDKLHASMEAWVWVTCERRSRSRDSGILCYAEGLGSFPWRGVLTWENSD